MSTRRTDIIGYTASSNLKVDQYSTVLSCDSGTNTILYGICCSLHQYLTKIQSWWVASTYVSQH